jgi:CheY-like chemotaxis protein
LILLDIGLPTLNGIEAARRIRSVYGLRHEELLPLRVRQVNVAAGTIWLELT